MAAPASIRIPWRLVHRQMSACSTFLRTQPANARRHASSAASTPEINPNPNRIPGSHAGRAMHLPPQELPNEFAHNVLQHLTDDQFAEGIARMKKSGKFTDAMTNEIIEQRMNYKPPSGEVAAIMEQHRKAANLHHEDLDARLPRAVTAAYMRPLRQKAKYGVPACDLQLRSYSIRNLEFFADFALRAAYFCGLPASGPVPLPRIEEKWTVPRGSFVHKKSQENFTRRTVRRLIQIKDGNPESVEIWLSFLQKNAYYGIGMKANVWNYEKIGLGEHMDATMHEMRDALNERWDRLAVRKGDTMAQAIELIDRGGLESAAAPPTRKLPPKGSRGLGYGPSAPSGAKSSGEGDEDEEGFEDIDKPLTPEERAEAEADLRRRGR